MPAGIQIFLDDGTVQISDEDIVYSLVQKGTVPSTAEGGTWGPEWGPSSALHTEITFPVPSTSNPMLALNSTNPCWCSKFSETPTTVTFRIYATSSGTSNINYYLFTTAPPPPSNYFEIYNSSGVRVFGAETPPARPIGTFVNNTYSGIPISGREIAFVPQKMEYTHYVQVTHGSLGSCRAGGAYDGYQHYWAEQWQATALRCHSSTGIVATARTAYLSYPYICSLQPQPMYNSSSSYGHSALILDVTNY